MRSRTNKQSPRSKEAKTLAFTLIATTVELFTNSDKLLTIFCILVILVCRQITIQEENFPPSLCPDLVTKEIKQGMHCCYGHQLRASLWNYTMHLRTLLLSFHMSDPYSNNACLMLLKWESHRTHAAFLLHSPNLCRRFNLPTKRNIPACWVSLFYSRVLIEFHLLYLVSFSVNSVTDNT